MQINWPTIGEKVYSILKGSCKSVSMYDAKGNSTIDPEEATRFFAIFKSYSKKLETFTILVACHNEGHDSHIDIKTPNLKNSKDFAKIHQVRNHIRTAIGEREGIKVNWLVFDHAINLKDEALNNLKESSDLTWEGTNMKHVTDKSIAESKDVSKVYGTTKSSFQQIGEAKLIIRHSAAVNENVHGARSRQIRALFVENKIGERFAYPHLHVSGARAFARHISNGGTNHDVVAEKLFSLSEDYIKLRRSSNSLRVNESANPVWIERLRESMHDINRTLKRMHGPKGYTNVSSQLLEETTSDLDENEVNSLQLKLAECCSCPADSAGYTDLGTAAKYIAKKGPIEEPITFTWSGKPDISRMTNFSSVAEQLNWQINELASSCSNDIAATSLKNIAEQIANGVMPSEGEMNLIRRAFESSQNFAVDEAILPEESELNEYLDSFNEENIFAEELTDEGNEFSGALAAAKAKGENTFDVDGKKYHVKENDLEEDEYDVNSAIVNKPGHPMHGARVDLMHKVPNGFMGSGLDPKTRKMTNHNFKKEELKNINYSGPARGYRDELEEDSTDSCNMTAEGNECPIHGMQECMAEQRITGINPREDGNLDEVSIDPDDDFDDFEDADQWDGDMDNDVDSYDDDRSEFADPGGNSALRAATPDNPRIHDCPTCGHPNRLTAADVSRGYQCDSCADAAETGREINYYEPDIDGDDDLYESQVARIKNLAGLK